MNPLSASPSNDQKNQLNPVSSSQTSYLTVPAADGSSGNNAVDTDKKPSKRKSLSDAGNLTHSPIKHDLRQV